MKAFSQLRFKNLKYRSFLWNFGTTSFRTKYFNFSIEKQLYLIDSFWRNKSNGREWTLETQEEYYKYLQAEKFLTGDDKDKAKAAREKTSGLVDMGLLTPDRQLTEAGEALLDIGLSGDYRPNNMLGIPKDSMIYLQQLLKYGIFIDKGYVRPFIVILYLLSELDYLSYDEFRFLAPLCIDKIATESVIAQIKQLRDGKVALDDIIYNEIMAQENYREALKVWMENSPSEDLICAIGLNRKSRNYDKPYFALYNALKEVFLLKNYSDAYEIYDLTRNISVGVWWRDLIFDTFSSAAIKKEPRKHLNKTEFSEVTDEEELKRAFFKYLHLFKAKATLKDYFDLNRRYIKLTNIVLFEEQQIKLDLVPKQFFGNSISSLYQQAYYPDENLTTVTPLEAINPALKLDKDSILSALNKELGVKLDNLDEAYSEVEKQKYKRFNAMLDSKFTDETLISLLEDFEKRNDGEISKKVCDNADIPTIFEYILGIIWYKTSERRGKILDYMKLSLDADLLPVTHAGGGEADIVYEYPGWEPYYPKHDLLLEATLADRNNQRRMEMEPVSRHLGRHLLRTRVFENYCIFATTHLDINVISDFKSRKRICFYDSANTDDCVPGMKIIPLDTSDLKEIIKQKMKYRQLYSYFEKAYKDSDNFLPKEWYESMVKLSPV